MCDGNIFTDPIGCSPINEWGMDQLTSEATDAATSSAWESICTSFAEAAVQMLQSFAQAFVTYPNINLTGDGIQSAYGISLGIAFVVASFLLLIQVAKTAITHNGKALAEGLVGVGKAALAFLLTLTVASTALVAADELAAWIVDQAFGSPEGLKEKLGLIMDWNPDVSISLILLLSIVGIILVMVLWFEMLLRNAALAVLIATSPIAAAGQVSEGTKSWWSKLVAATIQLIVLKPLIALIFALGFSMVGESSPGDIGTLLAGMLILLMAAIAWPSIARFMTFANAQVGGGAGLGAVLGFAAGQASGGGGGPQGMSPAAFGQSSEARTMAAMGQRGGGAAGGAMKGAGAVAGPLALVAAGLQAAQKGANTLTQRMEQTAGQAGLDGANPYAHPAGIPKGGPNMAQALSAAAPGGQGQAKTAPPPPESKAAPPPPAAPEPPHSAVQFMKGDDK